MAGKRAKFRVEELVEDKPVVDPESEMAEEKVETVEEMPKEEKPVETAETPEIEIKKTTPESEVDVTQWLKDVKPDTSKEVEKSSPLNLKVVLILIVLLLVGGAIAGGVYYYNKNVNKEVKTEETKALPVTVVPSQSETTPTPSSDTKVSLEKLSVQVLNGSGKVGEAGVAKSALTKIGFTAGNITTGNASSYDFENMEISAKKGTSTQVTDIVIKELSEKYEYKKDGEIKTLDEGSKYDVVIVIGKLK